MIKRREFDLALEELSNLLEEMGTRVRACLVGIN